MTPTINDIVNDDGSVVRTTTITFPNGDTDVRTHTYSATEYQNLQTNLQNQLDDLQSQLTMLNTNVAQVQNNLSKRTLNTKV